MQVVCSQLNCGDALEALTNAAFGEGTGPIWMDNIQCTGQETKLAECGFSGWGIHNCRHREDAGVVCEGVLTYKSTFNI